MDGFSGSAARSAPPVFSSTKEDLSPVLPAVLGPEDAALPVRPEHVAEGRDENDVRILRVDEDPADRARVGETDAPPRGAAVVRAIHPVARPDVVARLDVARAHVDHVRVRRRERQRADRGRARAVEDRRPRAPRILRLPHAAGGVAQVVLRGIVGDPLGHRSPPGAERADEPPAEVGVQRGIDGLGEGGGARECRGKKEHGARDSTHR